MRVTFLTVRFELRERRGIQIEHVFIYLFILFFSYFSVDFNLYVFKNTDRLIRTQPPVDSVENEK